MTTTRILTTYDIKRLQAIEHDRLGIRTIYEQRARERFDAQQFATTTRAGR
jgi:hypothetical protein